MDERALTERLVTYDTSTLEGMQSAAGFVKGWLEARDVEVTGDMHNGRPVLAATVGPRRADDRAPRPPRRGARRPEQFAPRVDGDRLYGRGAYDMKGGLAAMMCALHDLASSRQVRVHFVCVSDEESEEDEQRGSDYLVEQGYVGDFAITGEPTDLHIGVQAKGVLALRIEVPGKSAHGSTPWVGDNAVLKAIDVFRQIESLPFARESSDLFDRPSINLGRIVGGDALNKVPDLCVIDVDVRYLPGQDPSRSSRPSTRCRRHGTQGLPPPAGDRRPREPFVQALGEAIARVAAPPASRSRSAATAPRTRSRSSRPACPRSSSARSAMATTGPRSGCRSGRSGSIGGRSWSSSVAEPASGPPVGAPGRATPCASPDRCSRTSPAPASGSACCSAALVIFAAAGATAVAAFHEVDKVVDAFERGPELKLGQELAKTDPGKPQTMMILGSDRAAGQRRGRGRGALGHDHAGAARPRQRRPPR